MTKTLIENLNKTRKNTHKNEKRINFGKQENFSMLSHFLPLCVLSHRFCNFSKNFPPKDIECMETCPIVLSVLGPADRISEFAPHYTMS